MTREEAIKILSDTYDIALFSVRTALETLIPEFRESEDERIRKEIIYFIEYEEARGNIPDGMFQAKRPGAWISYLEKQKEQKPVETQDYSGLSDLERAIHRRFLAAGVENVPVTIIKETAQDCLSQMKPTEWSEADESMRWNVISIVGQSKSVQAEEMLDWLKSLRPSWKPSKKQMDALWTAKSYYGRAWACDTHRSLESLYDDLEEHCK